VADNRQCEFFLLRYVPDAVKNEFVNIGVVLLESSNGEARGSYADVRFTGDWRRVRCLDPNVDLEVLQGIEEELRTQLIEGTDREGVRRRLEESLSNTIQLSATKACLTESPAEEMERLSKMYLERSRAIGKKEESGRQAILKAMRHEFEKAGVWQLMTKRIPVAKYTQPGDPLKIDCGYRPNGVIKLLQAVPLEIDTDAAKVLAYSFPTIRSGIQTKERADAELTAIVEPHLDRADASIDFALGILEQSKIRIASSNDLARIAEAARTELRA